MLRVWLCRSCAGPALRCLAIQLLRAAVAWVAAMAAHAAVDFVQVVYLVLPVTR